MQSTTLFKVIGDSTLIWGVEDVSFGYASAIDCKRAWSSVKHYWGSDMDPLQTLIGNPIESITIKQTVFSSQIDNFRDKIKNSFSSNTFVVGAFTYYLTGFDVLQQNNTFTEVLITGFRKNL